MSLQSDDALTSSREAAQRIDVSHPELAGDYLDGVESIAEFLGQSWTVRKVRYARETGALPIRVKPGIGLYAFRSELLAALRAPDSLPTTSKL